MVRAIDTVALDEYAAGNQFEPDPFATPSAMAASLAVSKEAYLHEAQFALFACQMVEETLKSILMYARNLNVLAPGENVQISKTDEELDELPLGPLIKLYEKVFPNSPIAAPLHALRPERNHCAHRALVICFMSDVREEVSLPAEFERIKKTRQLAWSSFENLKIEMQSMANRLQKLRGKNAG